MSTPAIDTSRLPSTKTLQQASKVSIAQDKPIMLDYWQGSIEKTVMIGINEVVENNVKTTERLLVRNENEYTSPIANVYRIKVSDQQPEKHELIVITEHSIYIVDSEIPIRSISS